MSDLPKKIDFNELQSGRITIIFDGKNDFMSNDCASAKEKAAELVRRWNAFEDLEKRLKQAKCKHSFDVDGICEICGLGFDIHKQAIAEAESGK